MSGVYLRSAVRDNSMDLQLLDVMLRTKEKETAELKIEGTWQRPDSRYDLNSAGISSLVPLTSLVVFACSNYLQN